MCLLHMAGLTYRLEMQWHIVFILMHDAFFVTWTEWNITNTSQEKFITFMLYVFTNYLWKLMLVCTPYKWRQISWKCKRKWSWSIFGKAMRCVNLLIRDISAFTKIKTWFRICLISDNWDLFFCKILEVCIDKLQVGFQVEPHFFCWLI